MFSTRTKAWKRLSNTHADQIIAQRIVVCIFHKASHVRLHVTVWTRCLQRYSISLQEKKTIKAHVSDGTGANFLRLLLPKQWAGLCCPQHPIPMHPSPHPAWGSAAPCHTPQGQSSPGCGSTAPTYHKPGVALKHVCFTQPGNFPLYSSGCIQWSCFSFSASALLFWW